MSYTSQQYLLCDNSSIANFKSWGSAISAAIAAMPWVQQNDTGQAVWTATVLTLTQVATNGTAVYSYSSYTGPAPRIGMSFIITGFATGGNNGTFVLTAVSGGASGTVTVTKTTQSNETHAGSGTTTAQAAVPGAATYIYEIWAPSDALQTGSTVFYFKMEYGGNASNAQMRYTLGTGTNGAGTLTGFVGKIFDATAIPNGGATLYECNFSGDTNRLGMMLWRNYSNQPRIIAIERTKNVDGTDSSDGVTMVAVNGLASGVGNGNQTIAFSVGVALCGSTSTTRTYTALGSQYNSSGQFGNNIPMSQVFPEYGRYGNPMTVVGFVHSQDVADGCFFTTTLYGSTRTYIAAGAISIVYPLGCIACMRYD